MKNKLLPFLWDNVKERKLVVLSLVFLGFIPTIMCGTLADLLLKKVIDGLTLNQITLIRAIIYLSIYTILRLSWQIFAPITGRLKFVVFSKNAWKDRIKLFEYTAKHHSEFFINNFAGSIHNKINDAVNCSNQILREIMSFSSIIINALLILGIFCTKSVILAIYILFFLLIYSLLYSILMKDMKKISAENAEAHSILNGKMIDSLSSMWIVKMFSRESFEKLTLEKEVIHTMKKTYGLVKVENKISILTFISFFIIVLGISAISLKLLFAKTITLGDFIFNINSTGVIMWDVHYLLQRFSSAIESYGRGQNALNTLIVSHTIENYTTNKINVTDGNIIIKNMSFQYKSTSPTIFKDFNLNIKSNQKVGIVGYSGAGKSTLVNLLLRFYDVTDGEIHIDGQNIKTDVTQESLRNNISYIAQDPTLFHRSIKDNILYGKLTASEDELMEVAKKSCCYDFIMSLENKFDTLVGERGVKLSGGQRQRITIARAMLKNSKILILDEATSSLDSITEKEIQIALQNLMKDKTVIVIAHRLSTLNIMDRIIVIDNGKIVEDGKREELINNNGLFRKMWDMQRDGVLVDEKE